MRSSMMLFDEHTLSTFDLYSGSESRKQISLPLNL